MTDNVTLIIVAVVAAVAPTIAAAGAWRKASQANKAVNGRPSEAPTISEDVRAIRVSQERLERRFDAHLADHARARRSRGW